MTPGVNTVDIGASAVFQCSPEKNIVATITWSKEEGSLPSGRYSIVKGALYITNTTVGDNGMYVCTIRTDQGTAQASVTLNIKGNHLLVSRIKVSGCNISIRSCLIPKNSHVTVNIVYPGTFTSRRSRKSNLS